MYCLRISLIQIHIYGVLSSNIPADLRQECNVLLANIVANIQNQSKEKEKNNYVKLFCIRLEFVDYIESDANIHCHVFFLRMRVLKIL